MKVKRVLGIILAFVLLLCLLSLVASGSLYLLQKYLLQDEDVQEYSFWQFSLYILGYGESPNVDSAMQLILSVTGIIMISLLSAMLTIDLFRRAKDVLISKNLVVWCDAAGDYYATILIGNQGNPICNVSIAAQLFDQRGESIDLEDNTYSKPIIIKNHVWRVNFPVRVGTFMWDYFRAQCRQGSALQLYMLASFVDVDTGQDSIICKEYRFEDVVVVRRMPGVTPLETADTEVREPALNARAVWRQFRQITEDSKAREQFRQFIDAKVAQIDLRPAVPIAANGHPQAMIIEHSLSNSGSQVMLARANFAQPDQNTPSPGFVMALLEYVPSENWGPYCQKGYRLEFDISASAQVEAVQLEIKDRMKSKFVDERLTPGRFSKPLSELGSVEQWAEVHQLCFTVFSHYTNGPKGSFTVTGLQLAEPPSGS
ncbi:MAG: hypothetical protein ACOX2K_04275 [Bacillota bacterium]